MTLTAYSNKNVKWDLTLNGTTPSELTLVDIEIDYPGGDSLIDEPFYIPKFTFTFLGTKEIYDKFGKITNTSHPFELVSDSGYRWDGYLTADVFSMPNTGYNAEFSLNGISTVEALKFIPYPWEDESDNLSGVTKNMIDIINENTKTSASKKYTVNAATLDNMYISKLCFCMNDDDMADISMLDVLEWTLASLGLRLVLTWDGVCEIWDWVELFAKGASDYSGLKHAGIDETIETAEKYDTVSVECKEARVELANIRFELPVDKSKGEYTTRVRQGEKTKSTLGVRWYWDKQQYHTYKRFIGYFKEEQFEGWSFPKYTAAGVAIRKWWNPADIFSANETPYFGAYPMIYSRDSEAWEKCMIVISTFERNGIKSLAPNKPYAVYNKKIIVNKGDYISIDGQMIYSYYGIDDAGGWPVYSDSLGASKADRQPFEIEGGGDRWTLCPCPILVNSGEEADEEAFDHVLKRYAWLRISIQFDDKWWDSANKKWADNETIFEIFSDAAWVGGRPPDKPFYNYDKPSELVQKPWAIRKKIDSTSPVDVTTDPFFAGTSGYLLELPQKYGELVIRFYFPQPKNEEPENDMPATSPEIPKPSVTVNKNPKYPTLFLPNFQISKVNSIDMSEFFEKQNKVVTAGMDEKMLGRNVKKYDTYLGSYFDDLKETFLSTLYTDSEGTTPLKTVSWKYIGSSGVMSITERPENRIGRIGLGYISNMKTISDMLFVSEREKATDKLMFRYGDNRLWENGCIFNVLEDTVNIRYSYNTLSYA